MIWVGWRQQRLETAIAAGVLLALAAVAIPAGVHMASVYAHEHLASCVGNAESSACGLATGSFQTRFVGVNLLFTWSTLLPAVAALLLAAPFVLDLDSGTYRLFWTQSITRRRWLAVKLGFGVIALAAVTGGLTVLAMWARAPLDHSGGRMGSSAYDAEGIVPLAYGLFVFGIAVALGALWRRIVPALLLAFVAYVIGRAFMDSWLRERLLAPVKSTWQLAGQHGPNLDRALVIDQFLSDKSGTRIATAFRPCGSTSSGFLTHTNAVCAQPLARGAHAYMTAIYQPASRFWELQGIEFAIVAGIGALLVLLAAWWTQRRVA
ncbi:MAG TPA: hypothetical protein VFB25_05845 [Gaiellaceae bacterium]|nr:hypothetical protein [Gaiellaceae bacterium]